MAHVVEQGGPQQKSAVGGQVWLLPFQVGEGPAGQLQHPQGVGEPARLGPVEGEKRRPQLADAAQTLEGWRVDQRHGHRLFGAGAVEFDRAVQGIVVSAPCHRVSFRPGAAGR